MAITKSSKVTPLNLSGPVTREQFATAITLAWPELKQLAVSKRWCRGWLDTLRKISPVFPHPGEQEPDLSRASYTWPVPREDLTSAAQARYEAEELAFYATALTQFRRRALYFAQKGTVTLAEVNTVFAAMGLPQYDAPDLPAQYYMYTGSTRISVAPGFQGNVQEVLREALANALPEGITITDGWNPLSADLEIARTPQVADSDFEPVRED
jgi:hypothetical protein